jgi:hypothetical protein
MWATLGPVNLQFGLNRPIPFRDFANGGGAHRARLVLPSSVSESIRARGQERGTQVSDRLWPVLGLSLVP